MPIASIPVLTYHSIAPGEKIDPTLFEIHLQVLAATGLPSLLPHQLSESDRGFMLTFDDGYADLWTHVFPLLKEYNIKALVFVVPSKIGSGVERPLGRKTFKGSVKQALWESAYSDSSHPAFLRWSELRAMESSGLVRAQSHSYFHRMGWISQNIKGFHLPPNQPAHWSLKQATGGDERPGIPVYDRGSALGHRLYFDDPGLRDFLARWYDKQHVKNRFAKCSAMAIMKKLFALTKDYYLKHPNCGVWETDEEREKRSQEDIVLARSTIEDRLGGCRDELCLPWGHYDKDTLSIAVKAGVNRVYTLDKGANPVRNLEFLIRRFEIRPKGKMWLKTRLWIYRSFMRANLYGKLSGH